MDTILLMKDIDQRYRAISGLSDRRHYSIFYSRIDPAPLMVLGINPGGDPVTWTTDRLSSQTFYENFEHEYVDCQYAIQEPMLPFLMHLLGVGSEKIRKVPKSNLIFRRSADTSSFKGTHGMTLTDARKESGPFVAEIIRHVRPRAILLEGITSLDIFEKSLCSKGYGQQLECNVLTFHRGPPLKTPCSAG